MTCSARIPLLRATPLMESAGHAGPPTWSNGFNRQDHPTSLDRANLSTSTPASKPSSLSNSPNGPRSKINKQHKGFQRQDWRVTPLAAPEPLLSRTRLGLEVVIVLGLSLGQSAA